eukprot:1189605-Prorocentrum_minimum.AAC.6
METLVTWAAVPPPIGPHRVYPLVPPLIGDRSVHERKRVDPVPRIELPSRSRPSDAGVLHDGRAAVVLLGGHGGGVPHGVASHQRRHHRRDRGAAHAGRPASAHRRRRPLAVALPSRLSGLAAESYLIGVSRVLGAPLPLLAQEDNEVK